MTFIFVLMRHEQTSLKACLHEIESRRFSMQALGKIYTECKYITLNVLNSFAIMQTYGCDIYF